MQTESRLTRDAIAGNSITFDRTPDVEVIVNGQHFCRGAVSQAAPDPVPPLAELTPAEQLPRTSKSRDDRLAVISHELRNSLGVIRNATHLLNARLAPGVAIEEARLRVLHQVEQMSRLIEDLLDGSRFRDGPACLRRQRIDLSALLRSTLQGLELDIDHRGLRLISNVPVHPLWVYADPGRLEQVFANLLLNAAKYTDEGGEIALTVERQLECASVRIRDSGIGIAEDALPCVFGLFVQAEPSPESSRGGQGIGLAVVRHFVEMHGGSVTARSGGLGRGSEFQVLLPALAT